MIKKNNLITFFIALTALLALGSCTTPKDITYLQGFSDGATMAVREPRRITVEADDQLSIIVSSKNSELAAIFNLPVSQNSAAGGAYSGGQRTGAFTVSPDGTIEYPVLGTLHVAGMTRSELAAVIKDRLVSQTMLTDPVVTVEFLNATISVLGDVRSPGQYPIDRDELTILQAISKAGDLNITGQRTNVLVMREENGQNIAYRVDLTNPKELMESPAYYLRQNDVVYVDPNNTKKRQATANGNTFQTPSFWMSVASLIMTICALVVR